MKVWLGLVVLIGALWLKQRLVPSPLVEIDRAASHERWKRDFLRQVEDDLAALR